jgi:hypothetical protein
MLSHHFIVSDLYSEGFYPFIISSFVNNYAPAKLATVAAAADTTLK